MRCSDTAQRRRPHFYMPYQYYVSMNANLMAAGAFLLAFGALMIEAIPFTFLLYGVGTQNGNLASLFALVLSPRSS